MITAKRAVVMCVLAILVMGLAQGSLAATKTVNVLWGDVLTRGVWEQYAEKFEKETGIKVSTVNVTYDQRFDKIVTSAMSGVGTYDVVQLDTIWTPQLAEAGWLLDITELLPQEKRKTITPAALDAVTYKGRLYGLPFFNSAKLLYYNEKMLQEAGFSRPPRTLTEFRDYAVALTKGSGENKVWGTVWSWAQDECLICDYVALVHAYPDGKVFDESGKPAFNRGGGVKALQFMVDLLHKYKAADPASLTYHEDSVNKMLAAGKAAMIFNWEGAVAEADDPKTSKVPGQVRVALIPAEPPIVSSTTLGPEGLAIMKNAPNKEAALKFIEYMTSQEIQKAIFLSGGFFPVYEALYNDPDLGTRVRDFSVYGEQFRYGHARPKVGAYTEISDILQLELHNALLQKKTPQQALDDAAAKIEKIVSK
ncbi:MAG: ABC transporter substrate-binding protein [Firmicutes bacterium]|nr:ABC transporter substrate-binding protein [Bacillota bacterium]MDH7494715.1 ABC transporter substrate-binding protein [Bacillota bacterium]